MDRADDTSYKAPWHFLIHVHVILPVVACDEVVFNENFIHSHHKHSIDTVLHSNTGCHGEFSRLILWETDAVGCSGKFRRLNNPEAAFLCMNHKSTVSATYWHTLFNLALSHTSSKSSSSHLIIRLVTLSRMAWSSSWNPSSSSSSSSLSPLEESRTHWYHSRQWMVQESKWV